MAEKPIHIKLFGLLAEEAQADALAIPFVSNSEALLDAVHTQFPTWKNRSMLLAVNHQLVTASVTLNENDEIALMPPFSGG